MKRVFSVILLATALLICGAGVAAAQAFGNYSSDILLYVLKNGRAPMVKDAHLENPANVSRIEETFSVVAPGGGDSQIVLEFDKAGRLTRRTVAGGSHGVGGSDDILTYDDKGRLVKLVSKTDLENGWCQPWKTTTYNFKWDNGRIAEVTEAIRMNVPVDPNLYGSFSGKEWNVRPTTLVLSYDRAVEPSAVVCRENSEIIFDLTPDTQGNYRVTAYKFNVPACEPANAKWEKVTHSVEKDIMPDSRKSMLDKPSYKRDNKGNTVYGYAHSTFDGAKATSELRRNITYYDEPSRNASELPGFSVNGYEPLPVDLGLSVKWSSWNLGAGSPERAGQYIAWGEVEPKKNYSGNNSRAMGKPAKDISGTTNDAARKQWGKTWRIPTRQEMDELVNRCQWQWGTVKGVNGYKITGPNGNAIFLPAAGYCQETEVRGKPDVGGYWTSTPAADNNMACRLYISSDRHITAADCPRSFGLLIRPVMD